jgi:hypothetical protein
LSDASNPKVVCPESTIESANRRNFVKKAAVAATAVALGGSILSSNRGPVAPESSASSDGGTGTYVKCNFIAHSGVILDICDQNIGTLPKCRKIKYNCITGCGSVCPDYAITFGIEGSYNSSCGGVLSGQGIGSARPCNGVTVPNPRGLDFYTNYAKRMSITNCGKVGIGTAAPTHCMCVRGCISARGTVFGTQVVGSNGVAGCSAAGTAVTGNGALVGVLGKAGGGASGNGGGTGVCGQSVRGPGVKGHSNCCSGVVGCNNSPNKAAVTGTSPFIGVFGTGGPVGVQGSSSVGGLGILACSHATIVGKFKNALPSTCSGDHSALVQFENNDTTIVDWNVGVSGAGNASKVPDGNFYVIRSGAANPAISINKCGHVGLGGALNPGSTLKVCGSFAARIVTKTGSSYTMGAQDFTVLAGTAGMTVTLPSAHVQGGQIVFVKNISPGSVTVKAAGTDKIETGTTFTLGSQFASVQLVSNGLASPSGVWYIVSNGT